MRRASGSARPAATTHRDDNALPMKRFIALLRAVNVGRTGTLAMPVLRKLCENCGFKDVTTYINSGNVVFSSTTSETGVRRKLEGALAAEMGKPIGVHLRTPAQLEAILDRNPFRRAAPNRVLVLFLDHAVADDALADLEIPGREEVKSSGREIFIHYPDGMGRSKLRIPFAKTGTGRNLNTVRKLLELSRSARAC
jgi:uncharacterized protein (DUF1697 family)